LNFLNLMEAHVLAALRQTHRLKMPTIRNAVRWLADEFKTDYPLLHPDLATDGVELLVDRLEGLVGASENGQRVIRDVVKMYLTRINRDDKGLPIQFYPFTRGPARRDTPRLIVLDPRIAAGRPVIKGTRITPSIIRERFDAGEAPDALAKDYDLPLEAVHEAIRSRCERQAA
jgi:uncharacterized protein (DUF433 family)